MTGEEIKGLRRTLDWTARKLAEALGVEPKLVLAWEREELFPTKKHVEAMRALERTAQAGGEADGQAHPGAQERGGVAWKALADPGVWRLLRKLLAHPELRAQVEVLAESFADPADEGPL